MPDSDVSDDVNRVIQQATAKNPQHRYPDALAMAAAFREAVRLGEDGRTADLVESLTLREQEILSLIVEGNSNKQIANILNISVKTVETHRAAAMRKLSQVPWRSELPGGAAIVDLVGTTDLGVAVGVLKAARVFVGNDSGLMHVAAALGLVTVGIFGSSNPDWTSPRGRLTGTVVADGFECRPCYRRRCNQAEFCLDQVTADAVLAKVTELDGVSAVRQEES